MAHPLVVAVFAGFTIVLIFWGLATCISGRRTVDARIRKIVGSMGAAPWEEDDGSASIIRRSLVRLLGVLGHASQPQVEEELSTVRRTLQKPDIGGPMRRSSCTVPSSVSLFSWRGFLFSSLP